MKKHLPNITLLGIDCVDINRLKLAADICQKDVKFGSVKLLSSIPDSDPRVILINPIKSREEYSDFCLKKMIDFIDTEFVLVFQYDGFILNANAWTDEFLNYDYIGAPWWYNDTSNVGNGGFSLRSKKLLEILKNDPSLQKTEHAEDHAIARIYGDYLKNIGITFAPEHIASLFSIEGHQKVFNSRINNNWNKQFGFHGLHKTDISSWLNRHPEFKNKINNTLDVRYIL